MGKTQMGLGHTNRQIGEALIRKHDGIEYKLNPPIGIPLYLLGISINL